MAPPMDDPRCQSRRGRYLHLKELNAEGCLSRFPIRERENRHPPRTASWRNNLIALSRRRNLLFTAYMEHVYVWEPAGSLQTLGSQPEMIIVPVMKNIYAGGHISPQVPHAINHMIIDDLGREEVLLLATDSGNVTGYRVEAIYSALERAAEEGKERPLDDSSVHPFFAEHVGASAWGLAIHKFARLIAVSANTGLITVFAFALADPSSDDHNVSSRSSEIGEDRLGYGQTWENVDNTEKFMRWRDLMPYKHRSRNVRLTYTGHFTNIPSVHFFNSDLDPNGNWMVSTDIDNKLLVWKLCHSLILSNAYKFNVPTDASGQGFRVLGMGWSVLALDPRSFYPCDTIQEACGCEPSYEKRGSRKIAKVTDSCNHIPNVSRLFNYHSRPVARPGREEPTIPDFFGPECRINGQDGVSADADGDGDGDLDVDMDAKEPQPTSNQGSDSQDESVSAAPSPHPIQGLAAQVLNDEGAGAAFLEFLRGAAAGVDYDSGNVGDGVEDDDDDDDDDNDDDDGDDSDDGEDDGDDNFPDDDSGSSLTYEEIANYVDVGDAPDEISNLMSSLPVTGDFPILHFSECDIRLLYKPFCRHESVICEAPLRQLFVHLFARHHTVDRINMVKYIPEDGLVIAASQEGRAAIIALTQYRGQYYFRVDWIVPFTSQEKYGERPPLTHLMGMDVSPIQGSELPPDVPFIPRDCRELNYFCFCYRPSMMDQRSNDDDYEDDDEHDNENDNENENESENENENQNNDAPSSPPNTFNDTNLFPNIPKVYTETAYPPSPSSPSSTSTSTSTSSSLPFPPTFPERPEPDANLSKPDLSSSESEPESESESGPGNPSHTRSRTRTRTRFRSRSRMTLPELHAGASRAWAPPGGGEPCRGWRSGRRYRLLLMFEEHSVLSYEFWFDRGAGPGRGRGAGGGKDDDGGDGGGGEDSDDSGFLVV